MTDIKNSIKKYSDRQHREQNLSGWKAAVILIPVLIVIIAAVVIGMGLVRYHSMKQNASAEEPSYENIQPVSVHDKEKMLLLVSPKKPLAPDYTPDLTEFRDITADRLLVPDLEQMLRDAEADGIHLIPKEGYVSFQQQNNLYENEVARLMKLNKQNRASAEEDAEKSVPSGNHADARLGLSVRFASADDADFAESDEYFWLQKHSYQYGFILRFPQNKTNHTEQAYDPCLFRYVGKENALQMQTLNMCLDEYMVYLDAR